MGTICIGIGGDERRKLRFHLRRDLRLEWCGALQNVNLASRSLRHVSLAGCGRVQSLELACPSLTTLNLDECSELCRCVPACVAQHDMYECVLVLPEPIKLERQCTIL